MFRRVVRYGRCQVLWRTSFCNVAEIQKVLQIGKAEELYEFTPAEILQLSGGKELLQEHETLTRIGEKAFPDHNWDYRLFSRPYGYWNDINNQKEFLLNVKYQLNITQPQEWTKLTKQKLKQLGGRSLLNHYKSINEAIQTIFPETQLLFPTARKVDSNHWNVIENQRKFFEDIASNLGVQEPRDWAKIKAKKIEKSGGASILRLYPSYLCALEKIFPEVDWDPFELVSLPRNFWSELKNQKKAFERIRIRLNLLKPIELANIPSSILRKNGAQMIISRYSSVYEALKTIYPEEDWNIFDFYRAPPNIWKSEEFQRDFLEKLETKFSISSMEDWANISQKKIKQEGGSSLLKYHNNSIFSALTKLFPERNWKVFDSTTRLPRGFWEANENHKLFLDWFATKNQIVTMEQWSNVTSDQIREFGGTCLLSRYSSLFECLESVYPEKNWNIFDRSQVSRHYWDKPENVRRFMEMIKEKFSIESDEDWYRLSLIQLKENGGTGLLKNYSHRLLRVLQVAYPEKKWNARKSNRRDKRSVQRWLFLKVGELFSDYEIIEDFFHEELARISGKSAQFDLFIPKLNVAIEFNGIHHYKELPSFGSIDMYQQRDIEKEKLCKDHNIPLIIIPYTWDLSCSQLLEFIRNSSPELLQFISLSESTSIN